MKCGKCGKDCDGSINKDKKYGWICMDCYRKRITKKLKGVALN